MESAPDRDACWAVFVERVGRLIDDDDRIDRVLDAVVEAPPEAIALYASGGR